MLCEGVQERILDADNFDEELDADILEHIEACDECRTFLEEIKAMKTALSRCAVSPENDGVMLHERMAERIASGDITPSLTKKKTRFPIATMVAVAALLVIAVTSTPLKEALNHTKNTSLSLENSVKLVADFDYALYDEDASDAVAESAAEEAEEAEEPRMLLRSAIATGQAPEEDETADDKVNGTGLCGYPKQKTEEYYDGVDSENVKANFSSVYNSINAVTPAEILSLVDDYFLDNPCQHDNTFHAITEQMIENVGTESFVEWFLTLEDYELEYTVEAFEAYFYGDNGEKITVKAE